VPTVAFRMSCIYGPHQHGTEDQGWVAHFLIRALRGEPLMIYGDGKQVRDVLFASDLVDAFLLAREQIGQVAGRAYNLGGGPTNSYSLLELLDLMRRLLGHPVEFSFADWRTGDQAWYVSDTSRFNRLTGWAPRVGKDEGVRQLLNWLETRQGVAEGVGPPRLREASS
jgi:CDP-paratose 2-epimerase